MTTTPQECSCSWSKCTASSLTGTAIGLAIIVVGHIIAGLITKRSNGQSGAHKDVESSTPDITPNPLANYTSFPPMTPLTTTPGHAISDMDRDIRLPFVGQQEGQDVNLDAVSKTPVACIENGH
jgi:hypothetical protein